MLHTGILFSCSPNSIPYLPTSHLYQVPLLHLKTCFADNTGQQGQQDNGPSALHLSDSSNCRGVTSRIARIWQDKRMNGSALHFLGLSCQPEMRSISYPIWFFGCFVCALLEGAGMPRARCRLASASYWWISTTKTWHRSIQKVTLKNPNHNSVYNHHSVYQQDKFLYVQI
jgi:hypothetical protein